MNELFVLKVQVFSNVPNGPSHVIHLSFLHRMEMSVSLVLHSYLSASVSDSPDSKATDSTLNLGGSPVTSPPVFLRFVSSQTSSERTSGLFACQPPERWESQCLSTRKSTQLRSTSGGNHRTQPVLAAVHVRLGELAPDDLLRLRRSAPGKAGPNSSCQDRRVGESHMYTLRIQVSSLVSKVGLGWVPGGSSRTF